MNWIEKERVLQLHEMLITAHGGSRGLRDESALLAGLFRARNLHAYGDPPPDIAALASVYAGGMTLNHPFVDGNKRIGFLAASLFIEDNGFVITASEADAVLWTLKLAARACDECDYASWLRANMKKRPTFSYQKAAKKPAERRAKK